MSVTLFFNPVCIEAVTPTAWCCREPEDCFLDVVLSRSQLKPAWAQFLFRESIIESSHRGSTWAPLLAAGSVFSWLRVRSVRAASLVCVTEVYRPCSGHVGWGQRLCCNPLISAMLPSQCVLSCSANSVVTSVLVVLFNICVACASVCLCAPPGVCRDTADLMSRHFFSAPVPTAQESRGLQPSILVWALP